MSDDLVANPWDAPPEGLAWQFEEDGRLVQEDFAVANEVWDTACPDDQVMRWTAPTGEELAQGLFVLCVRCLERRLGRRLTREDFLLAPTEDALGLPPSSRLLNRWASE